MASKNVEARFKKLITQIRQKYANHDYSVCNTTDDLFLPIDLSAMIKYLDKRYQKNVLRSQIKSDLITDAKGWSENELRSQMVSDLERFTQLFSFNEDKTIERDLRKK